MRDNAHIVKRISVDLETDIGTPFEERSKVIAAFQNDLKNELEKVMDEFCGSEEVIRIDQLQIDLGNIHKSEFGTQFIDEFRKKLRESIVKIRSEAAVETNEPYAKSTIAKEDALAFKKNAEDRKFDALVFFLSKGGFPWWSPFESFAELEAFTYVFAKDSKVHLNRLKAEFANRTRLMERFVFEFETDLVITMTKLFFPDSYTKNESIIRLIEHFFRKQLPSNKQFVKKRRILLTLHSCFLETFTEVQLLARFIKTYKIEFGEQERIEWSHKETKKAELDQLIKAMNLRGDVVQMDECYELIIKEMNLPEEITETKTEIEKEINLEVSENMRLNHSGVVIAWPFIKILFEDRGLLENDEFKNGSNQWKGVHLLNYLVSGKENLEEYEMPLNKLLCGIHPSVPVKQLAPLTEGDKTEVNQLIDHIIKAWSALKNTSKEGLRASFIERQGLLEERENVWFLKVEQSGIDILMGKIPWGYSMIKLPWMEKIVQVEW
ncbi:MAG: hypothetical protein GY751_08805 [Bacteroidetes bacterium]|nr:hypothetical protein [Bacteroidota bacterium]